MPEDLLLEEASRGEVLGWGSRPASWEEETHWEWQQKTEEENYELYQQSQRDSAFFRLTVDEKRTLEVMGWL